MGKVRFMKKIAAIVLTFMLSISGVSAVDTFVSFDKGDFMLCKKG
jgi:hypothetical protein